MSSLENTPDGKLVARFHFPADFIGFRGHFPGNPVLPGACEVQTVLTMIEAWYGKPVRLEKIVAAQFSAPVTSEEKVRFECDEFVEDTDGVVVRVRVIRGEKRVAKLRLKLRYGVAPSERGNGAA